MNKRQIIASLNNIANELDKDGMHNEADELTGVAERFEDTRTPVEKMASEKIKLLQDKLRQIISESYATSRASRDGKMVRHDDIQGVLLKILFEKDLRTFLRDEAYKTGARFPDGLIMTIVHYINMLKENPYIDLKDVDRLIGQ